MWFLHFRRSLKLVNTTKFKLLLSLHFPSVSNLIRTPNPLVFFFLDDRIRRRSRGSFRCAHCVLKLRCVFAVSLIPPSIHVRYENGGSVILLDKSAFCGGNSTKATSGVAFLQSCDVICDVIWNDLEFVRLMVRGPPARRIWILRIAPRLESVFCFLDG